MDKKQTSVERVMSRSSGLKRTMKTKSAVMVGVGSTIGTGLFLSSGSVISTAGPGGAVLAYLIGGIIIWLMTSCLGELSAAMPVSGSLQAYSTEFIGPAMGFTIGWVNWIGAAFTITAQLVASAIIMKDIIPGTPTWLWIVVFSILLLAVNFAPARAFGSISFWVSSLKILLVVVFIVVGGGMMFGFGGEAVGFSNYTSRGGAFPVGIAGVGAVILTSFYAYAGTELVASTAGEIENEKDMPKAINSTIFILIAATVVSIGIVAALLPWDQASVLGSPFVYVFKNAGFNGAALVVNIIVLSSALTSGNYFVYACSRYLWSMSKYKQAPKICQKTSKNGVPVVALVVSMLFAMLALFAQIVAEDTVYLFLVYFIGGGNIFMYSVLCICQYRFRKRFVAEGGKVEDLNYKVASYPLIPILGVFAFFMMLVATLLDKTQATAIYVCAPAYLAIYIASRIYIKKKGVTAANLDI
ncbi:MAG: amino acid permease [Anaerovoracaceae bacterium]